MNLLQKISVFLFIALLSVNVSGQATIDKPVDFTVFDTDGNEHHLFDYLTEGKYVLLDFSFPNCSTCQLGIKQMNKAYEQYGCNRGDIVFIGITRGNSAQEIRKAAQKSGILYPMVHMGKKNKIADLYGITAFPTVLLIAPNKTFVDSDIYPVNQLNLTQAIRQKAGIKNNFSACSSSNNHRTVPNSIQLNIYPNPMITGTTFSIEISKAQPVQIRILNILGQKIATPVDDYLQKSTEKYFEFKNLKPGLYLVQLVVDGSVISTQRFSKIAP